MNEQRIIVSPAAALFFGIVASLLWIIALNFIYDLPTTELLRLMTTGAFGAVGGSIGALVMSMSARGTQDKLDQAQHEAKHDALTGLANRAELFRELDRSLEYSAEQDMVLGVLFLDLDRFKSINDSMGHDAGDELLRIVADRLRSTVRNTDVVARLGGDEFVVVCRGLLAGESVVAMARQIMKRFGEPITLHGKEHRVTTSIGVAIAHPGDTRHADDLVSDADAAMYRAKRTKSGFAVFDEDQRRQAMDRLEIERGLTEALEANQIIVHYQPIVNTHSKSLYGFEALVRWNHPQKGLISPGQFLPVAEEAGMMATIGNLVLREACAQAAVWSHVSPAAKKVKMGVNIAEQQLIGNDLPGYVAEILDWSGLEPEQLVLEITEDVIVDHLDGLDILRELRGLGVTLAIDDFGTGQSSLSYVKQFDMCSTIKIDQSFVRDMRSGNVDRAIIEAVVAMASVLDLSVVAEGVEHLDQLEQLSELGIELMQGYLFESPVGPEMIDPAVWFPEKSSQKPADNDLALQPVEAGDELATSGDVPVRD